MVGPRIPVNDIIYTSSPGSDVSSTTIMVFGGMKARSSTATVLDSLTVNIRIWFGDHWFQDIHDELAVAWKDGDDVVSMSSMIRYRVNERLAQSLNLCDLPSNWDSPSFEFDLTPHIPEEWP